MQSFFNLIYTIIQLYIFVIIAAAIMSWLVAFNVLNTHNRFVAIVYDMMNRLTEPGLRPIRRILPNLGGIDISPVILILILIFLQNLLLEYFIRPGAIAHF